MIEAGRLVSGFCCWRCSRSIIADIVAGTKEILSAHFAPVLAETGNTQATSIAGIRR
jgi:hypothetical protein